MSDNQSIYTLIDPDWSTFVFLKPFGLGSLIIFSVRNLGYVFSHTIYPLIPSDLIHPTPGDLPNLGDGPTIEFLEPGSSFWVDQKNCRSYPHNTPLNCPNS